MIILTVSLTVLHTIKPNGILASLDVENLFTNVPVNEAVHIIVDRLGVWVKPGFDPSYG